MTGTRVVALVALLALAAGCSSSEQGGAVTQSCVPIADSYELALSINGTPSRLALRLTRDGELFVDDERAIVYRESEPNGPGCGVCRQASVELITP